MPGCSASHPQRQTLRSCTNHPPAVSELSASAQAPDPVVLPQGPAAWHRRIWTLTWPVILANVTIPLVGVADVTVMGRLPDPAYIAAVTMGSALFSAVYWLFGFLRMATTGLSAQALGSANVAEIAAIFWRGCVIAVTLGVLLVCLQWPLASLLFHWFDATPDVAHLARDYYDLRILSAPALLVYLVELGILFGLQRMRHTLYLSVGLNLTNLGLDILLALGLDMGVKGVAAGTVISECSAAIAGWVLVQRALREHGWWKGRPRQLWRGHAVRGWFGISTNLILRTFCVQLPFFVGTLLATQLGAVTLAAHGILMQLFFIMTYSLDGFAHTAETLAGFAYGAQQREVLRQTTRYCALWAMFFALLTCLLFGFAGTTLVDAMSVAANVRQTASHYLLWLAISPLLCVWAFLFDGIFIGTTHIREMRNAMFAAALLWGALLWLTFDACAYEAVWLTLNSFMLARSILMALYYPRIERTISA